MLSLPVLIVGDVEREEVREAGTWLIEHGAVLAADIPTALAAMQEDFSPALIIIVEAWPAQFSANQIEELRQTAPLVHFVSLLGPWLEGESRTGKPWPATTRIYWHQWQARYPRQWEQLQSDDSSPWSLPTTAGDDERILATSSGGFSSDQSDASPTQIAIYAHSRETAESLTEICAQRGWNPGWLRDADLESPGSVDLLLFDAHRGAPSEMQALAECKAALGETPIVALLGFPRIDDMERFKSAGASAVLSKPLLIDDLVWQIEQFLPAPSVA